MKDYTCEDDRRWLTLSESGGHERLVPVHPTAAAWLDAHVEAAGIGGDAGGPLFRSALRSDGTRKRAATGGELLRTVKILARKAGVRKIIRSHTLFASGLVLFLEAGGTIETAKAMAGFYNDRFLERYVPNGR